MTENSDYTAVMYQLSCLYHLWVEAVVRQLPNKCQSVGSRLPHKMLFHSVNGLKVVLQQP